MTRDDIEHYFLLKNRKQLTNKEIAKAIGCSESLVSHYFKRRCNLSKDKELKLKRYIDEAKEYKMIRVAVE